MIKPEHLLLRVCAKPREAVFSTVNPKLVSGNQMRRMRGTGLEDLLKEVKDDRLLSLVGGLIVEESVDHFLKTFVPGFKALSNRRDVTHSIKIDFARAMGYAPPMLFGQVDLVRKIRNEFAHHLKITNFQKLGRKLLVKLRAFEPGIPMGRLPTRRLEKDRMIFISLTLHISMQLRIYSFHTKALNRFIRIKRFHRELETFLRNNTNDYFLTSSDLRRARSLIQEGNPDKKMERLLREVYRARR
jgi:hypothetical protein